MSMGYYGEFDDTISDENLKKFCPKEYQNFLDSMKGIAPIADLTLDEVAQQISYGDPIENKNVEEALNTLQNKFNKKTGLNLFLNYHDSANDGDRYDEVDLHYWGVLGMYELTKAGKKMKKYVERKNFVMFG